MPFTALINGIFNAGAVNQQNQYNKELARYQNAFNLEMWNKQNEYNSPNSTMERLVQAGINPRAYNQLGQFANSADAPQAVGYSKTSPLSAFSDLALTMAQLKNLESQTAKNEADTENKNADTANKVLYGEQRQQMFDYELNEKISSYREIFENVMLAIEDYVINNNSDIVLEGENKILNHPEYTDSEKVKNFLSVVTSKNKLAGLLAGENDNIEVSIKIGGEGSNDMPSDCSLVTATYSASGVKIGTYGVIGPLRMDYQKVVSVLEGVGQILEDLLKKKE